VNHRIIRYEPEFRERVAALHAEAFGLDPSESCSYLAWKYEENPYLQEPLLFLALNDAEVVVGMRGFYGTRWNVDGSSLCIPCADDFVILHRERNLGLATTLMQDALAKVRALGFRYVLNSSGSPITVLQQLAMGWRSLGAMEPVERLTWRGRLHRALADHLTRVPGAHRLAHRFGPDVSACLARLERSAGRAESHRAGITLGVEPRADVMAELAADCRDDQRVSHVRGPEFFRWRFRNPTREYRYLYLERAGVLHGYLIVTTYRQFAYRGLPCSIADLVGRSDRDRTDLIETVLSWGDFSAIGAWSAAFSPDDRESLEHAGFVPSELQARARGMPCILLKTLNSERTPGAGLDKLSWDVRFIDSMHG